jgi:hypothetical protein
MVEERRQDQSCVIRRGDCGKKRPQPQKSVLVSSPGEDGFFSSEAKYDRRTAPRPELFVSVGRLQKTKETTLKICSGFESW